MVGAFGEVVRLAGNATKSKADKEKVPKKQKGKRVSFAAGKEAHAEEHEGEAKTEEARPEDVSVQPPVKKGKQHEVGVCDVLSYFI